MKVNAIEYDRHRDQPIFMGNDGHQVPKKVSVTLSYNQKQ